MEVRVQTFRGAIAIIGAIFFTMVAGRGAGSPGILRRGASAQPRQGKDQARPGGSHPDKRPSSIGVGDALGSST